MLVLWDKTSPPPSHSPPTNSWHLDCCLLRCESRLFPPTVVVAASFIEALWRAKSWWPCCWSFKIGSDENLALRKNCVSWRSRYVLLLIQEEYTSPSLYLPLTGTNIFISCFYPEVLERQFTDNCIHMKMLTKITWKDCGLGAGKQLCKEWRLIKRTEPGNL